MAHPDFAMESRIYRPKRFPRVVRRQWPVLRLCAVMALVGLITWAASRRNLVHDELVLRVGVQYKTLDSLSRQIEQLDGLIKSEGSFTRISRWAKERYGWRPLPDHTQVLTISESALSQEARAEARRLGVVDE